MKHLTQLILFSAILTGCSVTPKDDEPPNTTDTFVQQNPKPTTSTEPVISEEAFNKIPKNLRPADLEKRDDTSVVIRAGNNRTIREYRINGFLYGIQVIPKEGPPYYLVAADHMGNFINTGQPGMLIPSWTIFHWQ